MLSAIATKQDSDRVDRALKLMMEYPQPAQIPDDDDSELVIRSAAVGQRTGPKSVARRLLSEEKTPQAIVAQLPVVKKETSAVVKKETPPVVKKEVKLENLVVLGGAFQPIVKMETQVAPKEEPPTKKETQFIPVEKLEQMMDVEPATQLVEQPPQPTGDFKEEDFHTPQVNRHPQPPLALRGLKRRKTIARLNLGGAETPRGEKAPPQWRAETGNKQKRDVGFKGMFPMHPMECMKEGELRYDLLEGQHLLVTSLREMRLLAALSSTLCAKFITSYTVALTYAIPPTVENVIEWLENHDFRSAVIEWCSAALELRSVIYKDHPWAVAITRSIEFWNEVLKERAAYFEELAELLGGKNYSL